MAKGKVKIEVHPDDIVSLVKNAMGVEDPDYVNQNPPITSINLPNSTQLPKETTNNETNLDFSNLRTALSNPPLKSDYHPSKLRRIGATVAGGLTGFSGGPKAGIETAEGILESPYKEKYQDWLTKTGALEKGATLDINKIRADQSGYAGMASLIRAQQSGDIDLQGKLAGAKEGAKQTPDQKNYQNYVNLLPDEETPMPFQDFLKLKGSGTLRNTSIHTSVKDAREQGLQLKDENGNIIDTTKLPDNMEYRAIIGGPHGMYYVPDTQATKVTTMGNIRSVVPSLTPTSPIISGEARTSTETSREIRGTEIDPETGEAKPVFEKQFSVSTPQTTGTILQNQIPNKMPVVNAPGQSNQPIQSQIQQPQINNNQPQTRNSTIRPAGSYSQTEIQRQDKYIIPSSAAMSQVIGDPKQGFKGLDSFAHIADDKEAMDRVGGYIRLLLDNITSAGGGGEEVGAQIGPMGAQATTGGLLTLLKNKSGLTQYMTNAQIAVINKAAAKLTPEEDEFAARLIAAAGDVVGFRSVIGGGAYKWSVDRLKAELPIPGYGIKAGEGGSKSFYNRLASVLTSVSKGLEAAGVPDARLPYSKTVLAEKAAEFSKLGQGKAEAKRQRNISIEEVK